MSLTPDTIAKIAHLARLDISPSEAEDVRKKLEGIFGLIDEMQNVNTTGIAPMSHAQDMIAALREDRVTEINAREKYQAIAPATQDGYYLVPKVIE
jgi:aspartyl-tRNA(Asn)/glutamyl-tRNA(Gln) amidotransferase subunit C